MSETAPRRRALIVGIDTYVPPVPAGAPPPSAVRDGRSKSKTDGRRTTYVDLAGSVRDARAVQQMLLDIFGFRPEEVRLLLDREATRAAILAGLEDLCDGAGPDDEIFFYFAGHGSQVRNLLSDELDKLDESLVPADSAAGAPDLRDKELRRLANRMLDRGARLTVVLDSCHSGSALRLHVEGGRTRRLLNDTRDVADGPPYGPKPEDRGALVLSAAQDDEPAREVKDEAGQWHGAFTQALVRALAVAGPRESVERLFLRAKARMLTGEMPQEPVLAATRARRQAPLLRLPAAARTARAKARAKRMRDLAAPAGPSREAAAMPAAAVQRVWPNGTVTLVGGIATALLPGCELVAEEADIRIEVTAAGEPGHAEGRVVAGDPARLAIGMLCQLSRWSVAGEPSLTVWIPSHPGPWEEVEGFARELERGAAAAGVRWIADPVAEAPAHVLAWMGEGWRLSTADGEGENLGPQPRPAEVLGRAARLAAEATVDGSAAPAGLFVHLPAPAVLAAALRLGAGSANDAVERTAGPGGSHYRLVGRLGPASVDFAWVRPGVGADDHSPLPAHSEWVPLPQLGGRGGGPAVAAFPLEQAALRLARIRSWLTLEPPPGDGFPYRLALRPAGGGEARTDGELRVGEEYGLVLTARPEDLVETYIARRYVYVFLLDSWGQTRVFFPPAVRGGVENRFPLERRGREDWWEEIELGDQPLFRIETPLGVDTYFLLTSSEPIPAPHVLEAAGVRTRGPHGRTALEELLSVRGGSHRSGPLLVPADWSLERLTFETVP